MELSMPGGFDFALELSKLKALAEGRKLPKNFDEFAKKYAFFILPVPEEIVKFVELRGFKDKHKPVKSMFFLPSENAVQIKLGNQPDTTTLVLRIKDGRAELSKLTINRRGVKEKTLFKKNLKRILSGK